MNRLFGIISVMKPTIIYICELHGPKKYSKIQNSGKIFTSNSRLHSAVAAIEIRWVLTSMTEYRLSYVVRHLTFSKKDLVPLQLAVAVASRTAILTIGNTCILLKKKVEVGNLRQDKQ